MLNFFNGTATAMITPFGKDGGVNYAAFGRMIDFQIENGTDVLVVLGTTGEPPTLTEEEKDTALKCVSAMLSAGSSHASALPEGAGGRVLNPKHGFRGRRRGGGSPSVWLCFP